MRERPADAGYYEIALEIEGRDLHILRNETGGHRIQRIPPTERKGRVHTSTVTVAVLDPETTVSGVYSQRAEADFRVEWFSGTGKGGQHRNKHQNSCRVHHTPTGLSEARQGRERSGNLESALAALHATLDREEATAKASAQSCIRGSQTGSGMRGDKTVTIRFQDDRVTHHGTGRETTASRYMRGFLDEVWA